MATKEVEERKAYFLMVRRRTRRFIEVLLECQEKLPEAVPPGLISEMDSFLNHVNEYLQDLDRKDQNPIEIRYFAIRLSDQWQLTCMNNETLLKNGIIIDFEEDENEFPVVEDMTNFSEKPVLVKIEYQDEIGNLLKTYKQLFEFEENQ